MHSNCHSTSCGRCLVSLRAVLMRPLSQCWKGQCAHPISCHGAWPHGGSGALASWARPCCLQTYVHVHGAVCFDCPLARGQIARASSRAVTLCARPRLYCSQLSFRFMQWVSGCQTASAWGLGLATPLDGWHLGGCMCKGAGEVCALCAQGFLMMAGLCTQAGHLKGPCPWFALQGALSVGTV